MTANGTRPTGGCRINKIFSVIVGLHFQFKKGKSMKKINSIIAGSLCVVLALPVTASSLSGDEIKSTFYGKTAVGDHLKKGVGVKSFHASDGSYKSVLSDGMTRTGEWWVDSDKLCVKFDSEGKDRCRLIESDGSGGYNKINPKKGKVVVHFKSLEDGDKINNK